MSVLPPGWKSIPIGELCVLQNGRAFKPTEWSTNGIPIVRIQNLNNSTAKFNHFLGHADDRHRLSGGELLFAWSGTPGTSFGAHVWRGRSAVLNQHIFRVDFDPSILEKRFFRHAINQRLNDLIDIAHGGVGLRHVTKGTFEKTRVDVPPIPEQKRIADKLDAILSRVDACRERLDRIPLLLKRFRQSVLSAATSGELTQDWREKNHQMPWPSTAVEAVAHVVFDGPFGSNLKTADYVGVGVQVVRLENIGHSHFVSDKRTFISNKKYDELTRHTLHEGDILFSSFVDEEVRVAMLPPNLHGKAINKADVFCIRVDQAKCLSSYLALRLACKSTYQELKELVHGATRPRINLSQLRQFEFDLPGLEEQREIVHRIETLFGFADRLESRVSKARKKAEQLTPSLLSKAFRGELVLQDANDKPAQGLLHHQKNPPRPSTTKPKQPGRRLVANAST